MNTIEILVPQHKMLVSINLRGGDGLYVCLIAHMAGDRLPGVGVAMVYRMYT
jgi:hypothetical protein